MSNLLFNLGKFLAPFFILKSLEKKISMGKTKIVIDKSNEKILNLRNIIASQEFEKISKIPPKNLKYGVSINDVAFSYYQKVLVGLLGDDRIVRSLALTYFTNGKLWYPLPKRWRNLFKTQGVNLDIKISWLMWILTNTSICIKSVFLGLKLSLFSFKDSDIDKSILENKTVIYLPQANSNQLNKAPVLYRGYNLVNWLSDCLFKNQKTHILHLVPNAEYSFNSNLFASQSFLNHSKVKNFTLKTLITSIRTLFVVFSILFTNIRYFFLLISNFKEIIEMINTKKMLEKVPIKMIIFFNSVEIVKPLWAVFCEKHKVDVIQCFYSIQVDPKPEFMQFINNGHYSLSTWKNFWVVDQYQQKFLLQLIQNKFVKFQIVGIPYYNDTKTALNIPMKKYISVFDFSLPWNVSHPAVIGFENIYHLNNLEKFLRIILEIAKELNCVVLHKQKHRFNDRNSLEYNALIQSLQKEFVYEYNKINAEVAPEQLIKKSFVVVSIPVSTTAVIAKALNVPSIFFDPSYIFSDEHLGLREIPLLHSRDDLKDWIISNLNIMD